MYIKVKRDADEQEVLHQVASKLAGHVTYLTVHITKDEWSVSPIGSHSSSALSAIQTLNTNNPLLMKTGAQISTAHMTKGLTGATQQSYVINMSSVTPQSSKQPSITTFDSSQQ